MGKKNDGRARGKYTLEFKLEAVRLCGWRSGGAGDGENSGGTSTDA